MSKAKKIILFIVEGTTDEDSLALILTRLIGNKENVKFRVVRTDITTRKDATSANICNKIADEVKIFIKGEEYINKNDILKVIHIIDTDGAFIEDEFVEQSVDLNEIEYTDEKIITKNKGKLIEDHNKKKQIVKHLVSLTNIYVNISYQVYFFSRNLEHVLHDRQDNCSKEEKEELAYQFSEYYSEHLSEFIEFINNDLFAVNCEYKKTWQFIMNDNNSLKRYSNFHLYINSIIE